MNAPQVIFRVDASLQIGSGHLMRCLTLADALLQAGEATCRFMCRENPGHCMDTIQSRGFDVHALPAKTTVQPAGQGEDHVPAHAAWLGCGWYEDAAQTIAAIAGTRPDWLIVDHYALDAAWESELRPYAERIMAIDDLADRKHDADLLLDQNLSRDGKDYGALVPAQCMLLIGPRYSLLRPEFAQLREYSLKRRHQPQLKHLMISLGGMDTGNATGRVLDVLQQATLPDDCRITVVMGGQAPFLDTVREQAARSRWPCDVRVDVNNMAQLMADSDLAIGAAGSTSWERCCLGVPSLVVVLAPNQQHIAAALAHAGAAVSIGAANDTDFASQLAIPLQSISHSPTTLVHMSGKASNVTRGDGAVITANHMLDGNHEDHDLMQQR